jgi:hypothetical protein
MQNLNFNTTLNQLQAKGALAPPPQISERLVVDQFHRTFRL